MTDLIEFLNTAPLKTLTAIYCGIVFLVLWTFYLVTKGGGDR